MSSDAAASEPGPEGEPLLNQTQLAACFSVSENTVTKWRAKGMPVEVEGGNGVAYGYIFSDCKRWCEAERLAEAERSAQADMFVRQQQAALLGIKAEDAKAGLSPAEIKRLAEAELVYMHAARERRALVRTDEVIELLDSVFTEFRAGIDGLPDWLERELGLEPEQVERAISYGDELLRAVTDAIAAAHLSEGPEVVDPFDRGLL